MGPEGLQLVGQQTFPAHRDHPLPICSPSAAAVCPGPGPPSPGCLLWPSIVREMGTVSAMERRKEPLSAALVKIETMAPPDTPSTDALRLLSAYGVLGRVPKRASGAASRLAGRLGHVHFVHALSRTQNLEAYCERRLVALPEFQMLPCEIKECVATSNTRCTVTTALKSTRKRSFAVFAVALHRFFFLKPSHPELSTLKGRRRAWLARPRI